MKSVSFLVASLSLCSASALAAAPVAHGPVTLHAERDVVIEVGPHEADIIEPALALAEGYRTLFVNRCAGGLTITRGFNDSRSNTSSIIDQTRVFAAYPYGDSSWNQVMTELRSILAPFAIDVTDVDPGDQPHTEIVTCGESFRGPNVLGVAPFGCGVVTNAIGYAFAENHPNDPRMLAETIAHEAGHTFSLNHLYDCEDPMTYLTGCGDKNFVDADLQCAGVAGSMGWEPESCTCGGSTQNAHGTLMSIFGPAESTPPEMSISSPLAGARVDPGFPIRVNADDLNGLAEVKLFIDDVFISSVNTRPFVFNAPQALIDGQHLIAVEARDTLGATSRREIEVCQGADCVDSSVSPGELGAACQSGADCQSDRCAQGANELSICTEVCTAESDTCPDGFSCTPAGDAAVCWPTAPESGGCSTSGGSSAPWFLLALAAFWLLGRRRRV